MKLLSQQTALALLCTISIATANHASTQWIAPDASPSQPTDAANSARSESPPSFANEPLRFTYDPASIEQQSTSALNALDILSAAEISYGITTVTTMATAVFSHVVTPVPSSALSSTVEHTRNTLNKSTLPPLASMSATRTSRHSVLKTPDLLRPATTTTSESGGLSREQSAATTTSNSKLWTVTVDATVTVMPQGAAPNRVNDAESTSKTSVSGGSDMRKLTSLGWCIGVAAMLGFWAPL